MQKYMSTICVSSWSNPKRYNQCHRSDVNLFLKGQNISQNLSLEILAFYYMARLWWTIALTVVLKLLFSLKYPFQKYRPHALFSIWFLLVGYTVYSTLVAPPHRPNFALDPPLCTSTGIIHSLFTSLHVLFLASWLQLWPYKLWKTIIHLYRIN